MIRTLAAIALACVGVYVLANGGNMGAVDLSSLPTALIAFTLAGIGLLIALRSI